jgi:hypothetical protein
MHSTVLALLLVLRAYDMNGVSPHEFAVAERTAADVLGRAQIDVSLVTCRVEPAAPRLCSEVPKGQDLIVRLTTAPSTAAEGALADANVDTALAAGSLATVYVDRIRRLAAVADVDAGVLIGRAIAHEVGHLLLGTSSHSITGLMRAVWSATAINHEGDPAWRFDRRQGARLRSRLEERLRATWLAEAEVIEPVPPIPSSCTGHGLICPAQ